MAFPDVQAHRHSKRVEVDRHHSEVGNARREFDQVGINVVVDWQANENSLVNENLNSCLMVNELIRLENSVKEDLLLIFRDLHELRVVSEDWFVLTRVHFFVVWPI